MDLIQLKKKRNLKNKNSFPFCFSGVSFVNEVTRHSSYYYYFIKELPYLGNLVCWFGITGWVDVTDDESIFFFYLCNSIFVSAFYKDNDWWIKNCQLVFFLILVSCKNWNLGKFFKNLLLLYIYINNVSHLASSCLL